MARIDILSRRGLLRATVGAFGLVGGSGVSVAQDGLLKPTPRCDDRPTRRQLEGPYFKPRSPQRAMLRDRGAAGEPLRLSGLVVTRTCKPVPGALVDLWHADARGDYDNTGFTFRGHQFTDSEGFWSFETILPGVYPGRTRHFHAKFQAPGRNVLTTQLYVPGDPGNAGDWLFSPDLVMTMTRDRRQATFVAVLDMR